MHGVAASNQGLRARKKERTREAIVTAAIDLFERKGFDATTVEEIAAAADVSPRTFFRYFDSKVDLMMSPKSLDQDEDAFATQLAARPASESAVEAVCQMFCMNLAEMLDGNPLLARQIRVALGTPSLRGLAREHFNEHEMEMRAEIARRLDLPEDDLKAHVIAAAIGNAIWTVTLRWAEEDAPPARLTEMLEETQELLSKSFG